MYHIIRLWNKAKWHPVIKLGTLWKELAVACHMDETGQLWPPFTLGLLPGPRHSHVEMQLHYLVIRSMKASKCG